MTFQNKKIPKVSIGVPVYNGEDFLAARLDSILNQSFNDFEIILSDNASTDTTKEICIKYQNLDKRIKYHRQKNNQGLFYNYKFVLDNSKGDYFVIANADDLWENNFLKENIQILNSDRSVVVSCGKIIRYGSIENEFQSKGSDTKIKKIYKKFRRGFRPFNIYSVTGDFQTKAKFCLRKCNFWIQFGVFRRKELQKSMFNSPFYGWDYALVINTLRYGDAYVIEKNLMRFYSKGASGGGIIGFLKQQKLSKIGLIIPHFPLTMWCIKNIGVKFFIKNLDYFIKLNLLSLISVITSIIIEIKK